MNGNEFLSRFRDRQDAGRQLALKLASYKKHLDVFVLGLPRGGVVVAYEVAKSLDAPLDVFIVRKLGVPWQPELAMGAIAEGGISVLNQSMVANLNIPQTEINKVVELEKKELKRRQRVYRGSHAPPVVQGREIILVDDGLATGATMRAAIRALKAKGVKKLIIAVPVVDSEIIEDFRKEADEFICLLTPHPLAAIGYWYEAFGQTTDEEVIDLLAKSRNKFQLDGYVESEVIKNDENE